MKNMRVDNKNSVAFFLKGSWYHRTKVLLENGKTKYGRKGGFATKEEAETSYYNLLEEYEEQCKLHLVPKIDKEAMLSDYVGYWLKEVYKENVESTTYMLASYTVNNLILPCIPYDIKVRLITPEYVNEILKRAEQLGKTTANKCREILSLMVENAVHEKILSSNPVDKSDFYRRGKTNITILTKNELKKFLDASYGESWYLEILLALFCGLRKGEIRGLKFSDFNEKDRTVTISRQLGNSYEMCEEGFKIKSLTPEERPPKTENSYRVLRVPNVIWNELERRKARVATDMQKYQANYSNKDYVSCQPNGLPRAFSSLNNYITRICLKASIPKISVHGLRHMYAIILIEQGLSLPKISALLGHASVHTTFDNYLDVMEDRAKIIAYINNTFTIEN